MPVMPTPSEEVVNVQFKLNKTDHRYLFVAVTLFGYKALGPFVRDILTILIRRPGLIKVLLRELEVERKEGR